MKKALLVDDDYLVRSYLKMLPSWKEAGFEIVADVRDGEEALDVLQKEKIDLVVTDIAMPLMDGIQLIHAIRERDKNMHIIVLSCHDDFEYVKKAMQEGADEYVLKNTLDEKSLYTLLSAAMNHIQKKAEESEAEEQPVAASEKSVNREYLFFNRILAGTLKGEEREKERVKSGVRGIYQNSAVVVMKLEEKERPEDLLGDVQKEQYCMDFLGRFRQKLEELLADHDNERELIYLGNGVFCCFIDLTGIHKSSVMHQKLTDTASACYKICRKEEKNYAIGVSNICIGSEALRQAYLQARTMVKLCFYEQGGIAYYENGKAVSGRLPEAAENMLQQTDTLKYRHDRDGFQKLGKQVIRAFKQELTEKRIVMQWIQRLMQACGTDAADKFGEIHNIEEIPEILEQTADQFFGSGEIFIADEVSHPVRIAGEYAAAHFREPIGLNDAANAAGVNSTYLSYLFSQEMGTGFSNYLLNLRMEYAKKLLEESNLKMREVAEKSGFNDYHYFSKVFKKINQVSPAEYRKGKKML